MTSSDNNFIGFEVTPDKKKPRLMVVTLHQETFLKFTNKIKLYNVQAIEYKPFLRFFIAKCLNELTKKTLQSSLLKILKDRSTGAILLQIENNNDEDLRSDKFIDLSVLLSTAISHLIGLPNLDSMSGKFYARFSVKNDDNSDSYLRQAHRRMELHNDGTYVKENTDWIIMQKIIESNVEGGESLLLHLDDWEDLDKFYRHPLAKIKIQWGSPASKNVGYKVFHPIFLEEMKDGKPIISYIDQFAEPLNMEQGLFLFELGESLESESTTYKISLHEGSMLIINNYFWLHGRDKFIAHKDLHRELLRQRGVFVENTGNENH